MAFACSFPESCGTSTTSILTMGALLTGESRLEVVVGELEDELANPWASVSGSSSSSSVLLLITSSMVVVGAVFSFAAFRAGMNARRRATNELAPVGVMFGLRAADTKLCPTNSGTVPLLVLLWPPISSGTRVSGSAFGADHFFSAVLSIVQEASLVVPWSIANHYEGIAKPSSNFDRPTSHTGTQRCTNGDESVASGLRAGLPTEPSVLNDP